MDVQITNSLEFGDYFALHISWEDILLRNCDTPDKAKIVIERLEHFLSKQCLKSKVVWTLHNQTSHWYQLKDEERKLR